MAALRACLSATLILQASCSFIAMRWPTPEEGNGRTGCTDSLVAPTIDLVPAIAGGVFSIWMWRTAATADCTWHEDTCPGLGYGLAAATGIPALVYAASALYGFLAARACTDARAQ